jgi:queuosine precursor transporter
MPVDLLAGSIGENVRNYKYLSFITGIFTATLLISNTLDTKLFSLGPLTLPSGIILFPLAYIFGDVLTEVYGYATSRKVIWTGLIALLLMTLTYEVARILPAAPSWQHQEAFKDIFKPVSTIVLASITAYFIGEFCNSYVLAKIKVRMKGKAMPFRFVASTVVGQAVDTTTFVLIAYAGNYPNKIGSIILSAWVFKVAWEIIALPLTLAVVKHLKKVENEDYFDVNTNFNPFHLSKKNETGSRRAVVSTAP